MMSRTFGHRPSTIVLSIDLGAVEEIRQKAGPSRSGPTEIGFGRALPQEYQGDLAPLLNWGIQGGGSYISILDITSPGASGIRAGIRVLAGEGVELRFFDPKEPSAVFPPYVPKAKNGDWGDVKVYWSPTVSSDRLRVEIRAPSWDAAKGVRLEIERISRECQKLCV